MKAFAAFLPIAIGILCLPIEQAAAIGDFGPDTCMEGYVWREACGPNDHVCVTPDIRKGARDDNAARASRIQPGGGPYGPDTCKNGFVWREACGGGDHVCVAPPVRDRARADNGQVEARKKYPYCRQSSSTIFKLALQASQTCGPTAGIALQSQDSYFKFCLNSDTNKVNQMISYYNGQYSTCLANPH
jgi:hypothetical protein